MLPERQVIIRFRQTCQHLRQISEPFQFLIRIYYMSQLITKFDVVSVSSKQVPEAILVLEKLTFLIQIKNFGETLDDEPWMYLISDFSVVNTYDQRNILPSR